mmetsp:Transcript_7601/g.12799  ORF Transcript_7601/g.12799 Transcript_7601/m.12799 type:complete len:254 (-) Transcript_7601:713-1474(-)
MISQMLIFLKCLRLSPIDDDNRSSSSNEENNSSSTSRLKVGGIMTSRTLRFRMFLGRDPIGGSSLSSPSSTPVAILPDNLSRDSSNTSSRDGTMPVRWKVKWARRLCRAARRVDIATSLSSRSHDVRCQHLGSTSTSSNTNSLHSNNISNRNNTSHDISSNSRSHNNSSNINNSSISKTCLQMHTLLPATPSPLATRTLQLASRSSVQIAVASSTPARTSDTLRYAPKCFWRRERHSIRRKCASRAWRRIIPT